MDLRSITIYLREHPKITKYELSYRVIKHELHTSLWRIEWVAILKQREKGKLILIVSNHSSSLKYYINLELKVDYLASYHFKILKSIVMLLSNAETMVTKKESTYLLTSLTMK